MMKAVTLWSIHRWTWLRPQLSEVTLTLLFLLLSGGAALLAWCEDHRCGVRRRPAAAALPDCVQHRERLLLHRPGSALRHRLLQDIQGHPAGHPEVWWGTPIQVSDPASFTLTGDLTWVSNPHGKPITGRDSWTVQVTAVKVSYCVTQLVVVVTLENKVSRFSLCSTGVSANLVWDSSGCNVISSVVKWRFNSNANMALTKLDELNRPVGSNRGLHQQQHHPRSVTLMLPFKL